MAFPLPPVFLSLLTWEKWEHSSERWQWPRQGWIRGGKKNTTQAEVVGWTVQCAMDMHFATLLGRLPFFSALMKGFSPIYVHGTPWGRLEEGEGQLRAGITALPGGCSQLVLHTKLGGCCTARPF